MIDRNPLYQNREKEGTFNILAQRHLKERDLEFDDYYLYESNDATFIKIYKETDFGRTKTLWYNTVKLIWLRDEKFTLNFD